MIPDNPLLEPGAGDWTVEIWVNHAAISGSSRILVGKTNGGLAADWGYGLRTGSNGGTYMEVGNGTTSIASPSYTLTTGTWYQVVGVWTNIASNSIALYINGVSQGSNSHSFASIKNTTGNLYLGSFNGGEFSQWFNGEMGVFRMYNSALTASQILQTYNNTVSLYGGFNYTNFASIANLTFVGDYVAQISNTIHLTSPTVPATGNLYRSSAIRYDRDFSVNWSSYVGDGTGADGYCIQWTTTNNTNGVSGGGIGRIADSSTINAIGFYTHTNNNLQWFKNNVQQSVVAVSAGYWRQTLYFWADYNHSAQTLNLYYSTTNSKPVSPNQQYTSFVFDSGFYYIGFGAATGGGQDNHNILSWSLNFV
jgi:hypothetical protein